MTTQNVKLKLIKADAVRFKINSPALKLRVAPRVTSVLEGANGIVVTTSGGVTVIGIAGGGTFGNVGTNDNVGKAGQMAVFTDAHNIDGVGVQASAFLTSALEFTLDGAGSPIPGGFRGVIELPFACKIVRATLMAGSVGNLQMDVFKTTAAAPTGGASITAADKPTLTAAQFMQDTTLTGWSTTLNAGDVLAFYVLGLPSVTQATLSLLVTRF
jgi:hypothetical protein